MLSEESTNPLDADFSWQQLEDGLEITDQLRRYWREISSWSLFFGIAAVLLSALLLFAIFDAAGSEFGVEPGTTLLLLCLIVVLSTMGAFFWISSSGLRLGLEREESERLERGFRNLLSVKIVFGLLAIIYLLTFFVMIVSGIVTIIQIKSAHPQLF